jgi:hypothetical protein
VHHILTEVKWIQILGGAHYKMQLNKQVDLMMFWQYQLAPNNTEWLLSIRMAR